MNKDIFRGRLAMKKTKLTIFIFTLLLLTPSIYHGAFVTGQSEHSGTSSGTPFIDTIRDLAIEFEPPETIQDCGSLFFLNITITKTKFINLPRRFSISVFLKTYDDFSNNKIVKIGSDPFIFIPPFEKSINISIKCFTKNDILSNLYSISSNEKSLIELNKGAIGVRIERSPGWIIDGFITKTAQGFIKDVLILKLLKRVSRGDFPTTREPVTIIRMISSIQILKSRFINMNRFIIWKDVNVIRPFVCSKQINFEYVYIENKTNNNGDFNVTVKLVNKLSEDVKIVIIIDVSERPIFNSLIPSFRNKIYNVGSHRDTIYSSCFINETIKCSFPEGEIFFNKNYSVHVECIPYIPTGNTNQFGLLFYDMRWKTFTEPKYLVNGSVKNTIKELWYNTPIFYGDDGSATIFLAYRNKTLYDGDSPEEWFEGMVEQLGDKVQNWILIILFITLLSIGFFVIGYWVVKKHFK